MKTSTISTLSIQNAMRLTVMQAQTQLIKAQTEATSGKHADMGVALADKTSQSLDLNRDVVRLESLKTNNALITSRMESAQLSLEQISKAGQSILTTVLALSGSEDSLGLETARTSISNAFTAYADAANMAIGGEFLFSGINTDVQPLQNLQANVKTAFDTELNFYLGQQAPPLTDKSQLSKTQMEAFLVDIEKKFNGDAPLTDLPHTGLAGEDLWKTYMSDATDENMTSRISKTEVVETSTNANSRGMRYMALGAITSLEFMDPSLAPDVRLAANKAMQGFVKTGIDAIDQQRGKLGLSEERVDKANDSLEAQSVIIKKYLADLEGVDGFEASTRVKNLLALVDASYTLTARIQQLSLVNFL